MISMFFILQLINRCFIHISFECLIVYVIDSILAVTSGTEPQAWSESQGFRCARGSGQAPTQCLHWSWQQPRPQRLASQWNQRGKCRPQRRCGRAAASVMTTIMQMFLKLQNKGQRGGCYVSNFIKLIKCTYINLSTHWSSCRINTT